MSVTHEQFAKLVDDQLDYCRQLMVVKGAEYNPHTDRLANFRIGADIAGVPAAQYLWGLMIKHFASLREVVIGGHAISADQLKEKITDIINYLLLLKALLEDQK
jgi:hypothetical protein